MTRPTHADAALAVPFATPTLTAARGLQLARASADLWRVLDAAGRAIGHLQVATHPLGLRYRARRFHAATGMFRDLGDFWSADDAIASLRAL